MHREHIAGLPAKEATWRAVRPEASVQLIIISRGHLQPRYPALSHDSTHTAELSTSRAIDRHVFQARR